MYFDKGGANDFYEDIKRVITLINLRKWCLGYK